MLHSVPNPSFDGQPESGGSGPASEPYAEAMARLAGIRHALRMVDAFGGGPASDEDFCSNDDERIAAAWNYASGAKSRCFDRSTGGTASAASAGLDALLGEQAAGRKPNAAAAKRLAEEIRLGLEGVCELMLR
ncbi:MAG: hypothetical protein ABI626_10090 [Sphingomicrobium sp.]